MRAQVLDIIFVALVAARASARGRYAPGARASPVRAVLCEARPHALADLAVYLHAGALCAMIDPSPAHPRALSHEMGSRPIPSARTAAG